MFEGTFQLSMALIGQKCISDLATFNTIRLKDSYLSLIQFDFFNFEKHFLIGIRSPWHFNEFQL